jgi:hypothetical protein
MRGRGSGLRGGRCRTSAAVEVNSLWKSADIFEGCTLLHSPQPEFEAHFSPVPRSLNRSSHHVPTAAGVRSRDGAAVTFGLTLEANARRLSPHQRSALVNLALGALPWINRAFGRRGASPSTWVTFTTARALAREGLATISVSGSGSWLRLTARGRTYARVLAEGTGIRHRIVVS